MASSSLVTTEWDKQNKTKKIPIPLAASNLGLSLESRSHTNLPDLSRRLWGGWGWPRRLKSPAKCGWEEDELQIWWRWQSEQGGADRVRNWRTNIHTESRLIEESGRLWGNVGRRKINFLTFLFCSAPWIYVNVLFRLIYDNHMLIFIRFGSFFTFIQIKNTPTVAALLLITFNIL